jgi:cell division protein FtsQ
VGGPAGREGCMSRRTRTRVRQKQINILHTTTRQRHSQKQVAQAAVWCSAVLAMIVVVGVGLHFGIALLLEQVLYTNPRYTLNEIDIEPRGHFTEHIIRQAAHLEIGQNLWTLNLPQIARDLEKLPYVSTAKVNRYFPDRVSILITERVPVVKIAGINSDLGTREVFYLDRDGVVLKPREGEPAQSLPEIIGLTDAEIEVKPGMKLDQPSLAGALQILDAIDHTKLHTTIDVSKIDLSNPLSITMITTDDLSITFRPDFVDQQLFRLQQIVYDPDFQQRVLHTIDLTPDRNVPVTFNE